MIRTPRRCSVSCWVRIPRSATLAAAIAERAAGNPFFAEEMVRELVQRGVLAGERGGYVCRRMSPRWRCRPRCRRPSRRASTASTAVAKRTLNAASVIGARFGAQLLDRAGNRSGVRRAGQGGADRSGAGSPRAPNTPSTTR